jgi:hypothetical protein
MSHVHEIEKLLLTDLSATTVPFIGLAHPSPLEEQNFGQLGALLTISAPDNLRHEIAVTVTETLKDRYYHGSELNAEAAFEAALAEVNRKLHTLLAEGVTGWLPTFSGVAFAVKGDHLIVSIVGRTVAQLFRGSRIQDLAGTPGAERTMNPLKIFSSVIVGKLNPGDAVLFATPSLLDYYSLEKLKRLILEEAPGATLSTIETRLAGEVHRHAFGALLLTVREAPSVAGAALPAAGPTPTQPQTSMARLIEQEQRTTSFLTPSFRAAAGEWFGEAASATSNAVRKLVLRKPPKRHLPPSESYREVPERPPKATRPGTGTVDRAISAVSAGAAVVGTAIRQAWASMRRVERPDPVMVRDHLANLPRRTERRTNRFLRRFAAWPRNQQILAGIALILFVVFAQSVVSLGSTSANSLSRAEQQALFADARGNVDAASAALIYGDERGAATKLALAQAALDNLPKKPKVSSSDLNRLRTDLASALDKTQHRTRVDEPTVLVDFSEISVNAPKFLLAFSNLVGAGEAGAGQLAVFNRSTEKTSLLDASIPDSGSWTLAAPEGTTTGLLYTDRNSLVRFSTADRSFTPFSPDLPTGLNVLGIATFESKLYLLDTAGNRIVRLTRSGPSYVGASNWITEPAADIRNGVGIAVDGYVYVLRSDGTVSTFFQGKPQVLEFSPLDPPLSAPTRIWTDGTAKHIYVLDPPNHRLVVYDKQGGITEQIILPDNVPLTAFTVDEKTEEALILSDKKVLRVDLNI